VQFALLSQDIHFFSKHDSRKYNLTSPRPQPGDQPLDYFWRRGCCRSVCETSKPGIASQRLKKCAIQRQTAANTITASIVIRRRSSNSPRRSLIRIRQSGQGNLNTPIYDPCTSREICSAGNSKRGESRSARIALTAAPARWSWTQRSGRSRSTKQTFLRGQHCASD
jgi:hypothetical protein